MSIEEENLSGKVVLEVGSGRGDTTRHLAALLSNQPGAQLIVTDISNAFFQQLKNELTASNVPIQFICTAAQDLLGIPDNSVDYLVCNYTLCAVNSQSGSLALAIQRFRDVLKSGGKLFVEEEFPIDKQETPAEEIWAQKWRILKSAMLLAGQFPYQEIAPETLAGLCRQNGFENIQWRAHTENLSGADTLDFFRKRLDRILVNLSNLNLKTGFVEVATTLQDRANLVGGMEIPFYQLVAQKGAV